MQQRIDIHLDILSRLDLVSRSTFGHSLQAESSLKVTFGHSLQAGYSLQVTFGHSSRLVLFQGNIWTFLQAGSSFKIIHTSKASNSSRSSGCRISAELQIYRAHELARHPILLGHPVAECPVNS